MALGDTYNNNERKNYSPSVSSGYRFSNPDSNVDKTSLSFGYWNKLLKVSIAPKKETTDGSIAFDHDNAGTVYLSHTKALILHDELVKFLEDYTNGKAQSNVGVSSGAEGLIYICDGKEFNADGPCLVIRKIDAETGHSTSTFVYEFRRNIHNAVMNYVEKSASFENKPYELLEINQVITLLKSYVESMTMAVAYSIQEAGKYDNSRLNTKIKIIGEKLGVEFNKPGNDNNRRSTNNSYFANAKPSNSDNNSSYDPNTAYQTGSLDDLD